MAFDWSVPIASTPQPSFTPRAITPPDVSQLFPAFFAGNDAYQKLAQQNAFSEGLPRNADGTIDYNRAADILLKTQGVQGVPGALGLANQAELQKLPPIPYPGLIPATPAPAATPGPQTALPPSIQGNRLVSAEDTGGEPGRPGMNTVQPNEVPGSARVSVNGGPDEPLETPQTPQVRTAYASASPASDALPPQFTRLNEPPTAQRPVSGPPTNQFAQAPMPQRPTSDLPSIATPETGQYSTQEIARQDAIAAWATEMARRAALAKDPTTAKAYELAATQAQAKAQAMRESQLKVQSKQGETRVEQEKAIFDESRKGFLAAKDVNFQLDTIDKDIKTLGKDWLGSGAGARAKLARTYNTALGFLPETLRNEFGLSEIDPEKVASWESFNKASQKLGFALAKSLGSREAMQIVQAATASVPNADQSYWGARLVSAGMRQAAERETDFHKYVVSLMRNGQSTLDADIKFNELRPVSYYVNKAAATVPPQGAINAMMADPNNATKRREFVKKYGDGALEGVFGSPVK